MHFNNIIEMTFPTYKDIAWFSIMYRHLTNDVSFHLKDE
jgi:hypothetical protein